MLPEMIVPIAKFLKLRATKTGLSSCKLLSELRIFWDEDEKTLDNFRLFVDLVIWKIIWFRDEESFELDIAPSR